MCRIRKAITASAVAFLAASAGPASTLCPSEAWAGSPPAGFQFTLRNQTGGKVRVQVFNTDDAVHITPTVELEMADGTESTFRCNTPGSCDLQTAGVKTAASSGPQRPVTAATVDMSGGYAPSTMRDGWDFPCWNLKKRDASLSYNMRDNALPGAC